MSENITRRSFVGAAAGLAGTAALGLSAKAARAAEVAWDKECEVLVCGYGAAGASCAIEAVSNGAKVLIIEKAALPGGSMARCGGAIMGGPTRVQAELGVEDSADAMFDWVNTCVNEKYELCPTDIIRTWADNCGPNVDWLMDLCEVYSGRDLFDIAFATENDLAAGAEQGGGNGVVAGCLDATGCEYDKFGISREEAVPRSHWANSPGGAPNSGPELFDGFHDCITAQEEAGLIEVMYQTALYKLVKNDEGVVEGVIARTPDGEIAIKASKGVMLATGGYPASDEMKMRFCQEALGYTTYMCYDCTGDGILAAMGAGADLYNMCNFYPIEVAQVYQFDPKYNDVYNSWLDMDEDGVMEVPAMNMAECHGGVRINTSAQVLDIDGEVIPHLYASGCDVGNNIWGVPSNYPGCGCYVSFSVAFGRIAGANLAAEA